MTSHQGIGLKQIGKGEAGFFNDMLTSLFWLLRNQKLASIEDLASQEKLLSLFLKSEKAAIVIIIAHNIALKSGKAAIVIIITHRHCTFLWPRVGLCIGKVQTCV